MTGADHDEPGRFPCARCARPFARRSHLALHLARDHLDGARTMTEDERAAYAHALAEERAYMARIRRHARAMLTVVPLALFLFAILVLASAYGASPAILFLPLPPSLAVLGFLYYMGFEGAKRDEDEDDTAAA